MQIKQVLKQVGLNDRHAAIYLACLEIGSASIQKISVKSGFARSTCEAVLKSLQEKGFVTSFQKKRTRHYSPEDPKKLVARAQERVELLEEALPQFSARYFKGGLLPTTRVYEGEDSVHLVFQEILDEAKELIAFGSIDDIVRAFPDFFSSFTKKRIERSIPLKVILRDSPLARERQKASSEELREIAILPTDYEFSSVTYVWGDKIAMFSFKEKITAFVLESDELANIQRTMFKLAWAEAKRLDTELRR